MNEVDYIGKKSVKEVIRLSKLTKFIVFQQGATRGSTPVFRCTDAKTIDKAERSFEDWADSILRMNPNNNRAYELFLYSSGTGDEEIDIEFEEQKDKKEKGKTKTDKIRFSFSLNPYNNMYGGSGMGGVNVAEEIKKGIEEYKKDERLNRLEAELKELREGGNNNEEEEEEESAISKVSNLIKLIRQGDFAKVAGDQHSDVEEDEEEDIPDPEDDREADQIKAEKKKRMDRLTIALKRIRKRDPDWKGLYKLSSLAEKNPTMFDNYMGTLLKMEF